MLLLLLVSIPVLVIGAGIILYLIYYHRIDTGECRRAIALYNAIPQCSTLSEEGNVVEYALTTISASNAALITELERLEFGVVITAFWSIDDLLVLTSKGVWLYSEGDPDKQPEPLWIRKVEAEKFTVSSSGEYIAARITTSPSVIQIWHTKTGQIIQEFSSPLGSAAYRSGMAFSRDDSVFAASVRNKVCIWDTATGKQLSELNDCKGFITSVAITNNGLVAALDGGDYTHEIYVWDYSTQQVRHKITVGTKLFGSQSGLAFSSDERYIASLDSGHAQVWDLQNNQEIVHQTCTHNTGICAAFAAEDRFLSFGQQIWHRKGSFERTASFPFIDEICVDSNGKRFVGVKPGERLIIWDMSTMNPIVRLPNYYIVPDKPEMIGFDPRYMFGQTVESVRPGDIHTNSLFRTKPEADTIFVGDSYFDVSLRPPVVRRCTMSRGKQKRTYRPKGVRILSIAVSADGSRLAISSDHHVTVLDAIDFNRLAEIETTAPANSLCLSPDNVLLAYDQRISDQETVIQIWTLQQQKRVATLEGHTQPLNQLHFYNDQLLISLSKDGSIRLWGIPR